MPQLFKGPILVTNPTLPTRELTILVDPRYLSHFRSPELINALQLAIDLHRSATPLGITLLVPLKSGSTQTENNILTLSLPFKRVHVQATPYEFVPGQTVKGKKRKALLGNDEEASHCRMLLSIAESLKVDGIVTEAVPLLESRYPIYQDHLIRIVPLHEFGDLCEIFAHGHSIFWSSTDRNRIYTFDLFYQMVHWKGSRLAKWFFSQESSLTDAALKENLRTALLQRYPFVLYARDMTRFYELQMDFFTRKGLSRRFFLPMGYHVNNFYLHLWGMLDQLTLIAKYAKNLPLPDNKCGITAAAFWKEFKPREKHLTKFVKKAPITDWIRTMSDMRHRAAHNVIPMPTELLMHTPESKKTDEEIWGILKMEDEDTFGVVPDEILQKMKPTMISHWRIDKMKRVMKDVVFFTREDGVIYFWSPVLSIDHDLSYLNAIIDAFLVSLFSNWDQPKGS